MHAVSVIVGPTRAHWAQNDGTRAARAARGGRPCGAGPVTWPQQLLNAGNRPIVARAVVRVPMLLPMHRRAERHDAGPVGLSCAGLYWGIDVLTAARVHSAMQAPRHGAGVVCIECGRMHAHLKRPAAHSCCGHVTGPAPQGRPPGCTRRARAVILSPVSPCGANYYRNRVHASAWHCRGLVAGGEIAVKLKRGIATSSISRWLQRLQPH